MNRQDEEFLVTSREPVRVSTPGFGHFPRRVLSSQRECEAFLLDLRATAMAVAPGGAVDLLGLPVSEAEKSKADAALLHFAATSFSNDAVTSWSLLKAAEQSSASIFLVRFRLETRDVDVYARAILTSSTTQIPWRQVAQVHRAQIL